MTMGILCLKALHKIKTSLFRQLTTIAQRTLGSQALPPGGEELTFYFSEGVNTDYMHLSVSVEECEDPVSDDHN